MTVNAAEIFNDTFNEGGLNVTLDNHTPDTEGDSWTIEIQNSASMYAFFFTNDARTLTGGINQGVLYTAEIDGVGKRLSE